jgi:Tc5 transposase DNA-binding domain
MPAQTCQPAGAGAGAAAHTRRVAAAIAGWDADIVALAEVEDCSALSTLLREPALQHASAAGYAAYLRKGTDSATEQDVARMSRCGVQAFACLRLEGRQLQPPEARDLSMLDLQNRGQGALACAQGAAASASHADQAARSATHLCLAMPLACHCHAKHESLNEQRTCSVGPSRDLQRSDLRGPFPVAGSRCRYIDAGAPPLLLVCRCRTLPAALDRLQPLLQKRPSIAYREAPYDGNMVRHASCDVPETLERDIIMQKLTHARELTTTRSVGLVSAAHTNITRNDAHCLICLLEAMDANGQHAMSPGMAVPASTPTSPAREPKKRTVQKLTNGDRKWICLRKMAHPDERIGDMQQAFKNERNPDVDLKSGTVSGIVKQSDKWLSIHDDQETGTRTRSSKEPELEAALFAWRSEQLDRQEKVRDEDLRDKARSLAAAMGINTDRSVSGLSFSSGWLDRFKKRNAIQQSRYNRRPNKQARPAPPPSGQHAEDDDARGMSMPNIFSGNAVLPADTPSVPHGTVPVAHERYANAIPQPDQPPLPNGQTASGGQYAALPSGPPPPVPQPSALPLPLPARPPSPGGQSAHHSPTAPYNPPVPLPDDASGRVSAGDLALLQAAPVPTPSVPEPATGDTSEPAFPSEGPQLPETPNPFLGSQEVQPGGEMLQDMAMIPPPPRPDALSPIKDDSFAPMCVPVTREMLAPVISATATWAPQSVAWLSIMQTPGCTVLEPPLCIAVIAIFSLACGQLCSASDLLAAAGAAAQHVCIVPLPIAPDMQARRPR